MSVLQELPLHELRRLLIRIGAQANDLMDANTGKLHSTNAALVQVVARSSTRSVLPRKWYSILFAYITGRRSLTLAYNTFCSWLGIKEKMSKRQLMEVHAILHTEQFGTDGKIVHTGKNEYMYRSGYSKAELERQLKTGTRKRDSRPVTSLLYGMFTMWFLSQKTMRLETRANEVTLRGKRRYQTKKLFFGEKLPPFVDEIRHTASNLPHQDYVSTHQCLHNRHRNVYHNVFIRHQQSHSKSTLQKQLSENHAVLCALRKQLVLVVQPSFVGKRSLLMNHLFRADGEGRGSVAEIALAIRHKWLWGELPDVVVSRGCGQLLKRRA